jgi:GAF domain-containing protein
MPNPRAETILPQASPAALAPAEKLDRIFDILAERALQETGAIGAAIGLIGDGTVTCRATAGRPITAVGDPINHATGLTGLAIRRQMSQWCSDTESDARVDHEVCRQLGLRSIIVVPVSVQDAVIGVFAIFSGNPDAFSLADLNVVKKLSHWVSQGVEHTISKTSPASIPPTVVEQKHSEQQPPTIFNSGQAQERSLRNYAQIWHAMARLLTGGHNGRTG